MRLVLTLAICLASSTSFAAAALTYVGTTTETADATTHTYASHAIGTAADDRVVVVAVGWRGSAATTLNTATIAGVPAVIVGRSPDSESNKTAIICALVASGTTGDVVLNFGSTCNRSKVSVYAATGCSFLPADVGTSIVDDPTYDIDVPAGGFAVGVVCGLNASATTTWTGITEDNDSNPESVITVSAASDEFASAQTNLTVTGNLSTSGDDTGVFASWGPSPTSGGGGSVALPPIKLPQQ